MSELIEVTHLTFTYTGQAAPALKDVSLTIHAGEFITLVGATGSGKTTLLKQLKHELWPAGERTGSLTFQDTAIQALSPVESAQQIGYVAQDPQVQPIMASVMEELAFPLENLGYPTATINDRIAEIANYLDLNHLLQRAIETLSGGQLQLVNLASVLALKPQVILLDEPTAQLDPTTAQKFLNILQQVHAELDLTIVLTEHRLRRVMARTDRVALLANGQGLTVAEPTPALQQMAATPALQAFVPPVPHFFLDHNLVVTPLPLSVTMGRRALRQSSWRFQAVTTRQPAQSGPRESVLVATGVSFHYPTTGDILHQVELQVATGDWLAIIGKNGSGKSTLLTVLAGLQKPQHGKVRLNQQVIWRMKNQDRVLQVGYLSQNPTEQFNGDSVREELTAQAQLRGTSVAQRVDQMLIRCHLTAVADQNSFDLSGGQQQLLGLGLALMTEPQVLLLDEPTKGLDPDTKLRIGQLLQQAHETGLTIIMASHDMDFSAQFADTCTFMFNGRVNPPQATRLFFTQNFLATTAVNRLLRQQVPQALFSQDVVRTDKGGE